MAAVWLPYGDDGTSQESFVFEMERVESEGSKRKIWTPSDLGFRGAEKKVWH